MRPAFGSEPDEPLAVIDGVPVAPLPAETHVHADGSIHEDGHSHPEPVAVEDCPGR